MLNDGGIALDLVGLVDTAGVEQESLFFALEQGALLLGQPVFVVEL